VARQIRAHIRVIVEYELFTCTRIAPRVMICDKKPYC
jgi:hypothetical protein